MGERFFDYRSRGVVCRGWGGVGESVRGEGVGDEGDAAGGEGRRWGATEAGTKK